MLISQICVVAIVKSFDPNTSAFCLVYYLCDHYVKDLWTLKFLQYSILYFTKLLGHQFDEVCGSSIYPTCVTYIRGDWTQWWVHRCALDQSKLKGTLKYACGSNLTFIRRPAVGWIRFLIVAFWREVKSSVRQCEVLGICRRRISRLYALIQISQTDPVGNIWGGFAELVKCGI